MEQYGNTSTYNLETVLRENIIRSQYWEKTCIDLEGWQEVVDEIYYSVEHCEPWMSGNARGPSSAFCLLYRLGQLKPTPQQIRMMLDHKDSPYIRAVGFLYLRYVCNPRELWGWFKKYARDSEEFSPSPGSLGKSVTMGDFVRDILLDQYYFETIFPRIPKTVTDEIVGDLKGMGLPSAAKGNAGQGGADRRGVDDGGKRPASVKASLSVAFGQRAPNRAGAREEGRGLGAGMKGGTGETRRRSASPDPYREGGDRDSRQQQQQRRRSRSPHRADRDKDRERDVKYDRHRSDKVREGRDYRDARRERDSGREYRDEGRRRDYDAGGGRGAGYDRDRVREEGGSRRQGRDDRRDRDRDGDRGTHDVFRDRAGGSGGDRLKDVYG
ncbi:hypothetical protein N2152v2_001878 [Parachlorella kessleri]